MRSSFLLLCLVLFTSGCVATAAYVNIPPQDGTVARQSPDAANVINAEIVAVKALLAERAYEGSILLKLPENTSEKTYAKITQAMERGGVITPFDDAQAQTIVQVTSIRLRGDRGFIDTVSPGRGGVPQLATVDLNYKAFKGWQFVRIRHSSAPVSDTILYVPKVKPEPAPEAVPEPEVEPDAEPPAEPETQPTEDVVEEAAEETPADAETTSTE